MAYIAAVGALPGTIRVEAGSVAPDEATFGVRVTSVGDLVTGLLSMTGPLHPHSLEVSGDAVSITLQGEDDKAQPQPQKPGGPARQTGPQFELGADAFFNARHFVKVKGEQVPPHHHSYRVEATFVASAQDGDGLVLGFSDARALIERTVVDYQEALLNTVPPFNEVQPTCENIARVIHECISAQLKSGNARLNVVRVWESPTAYASYSDNSS